MSNDFRTEPGYEIDRGKVELRWLRFLRDRPDVATLTMRNQVVIFNKWLELQNEPRVRHELFALVAEESKHHYLLGWRKGN